MAQPTDKPRPRRHILRYLLCAVVILLGVFLGYMTIRDNHRHAELLGAVADLRTALRDQGVDTKMSSVCARDQVEFGQGHKHCGVELQFYTSSKKELHKAVSAYSSALSASRQFKPYTSLTFREAQYGEGSYTYSPTQKSCSVLYQYVKLAAQYNVQFSCDDTSWFVKTFE